MLRRRAFFRHFLVLVQSTVLAQDTLDFWSLLPTMNCWVWETFCWLDWYPCTWYSQCVTMLKWEWELTERWIGWLSEWPPLIASWRLAVQGDGKSAGICRLQLTANHAPGRRWKSHQISTRLAATSRQGCLPPGRSGEHRHSQRKPQSYSQADKIIKKWSREICATYLWIDWPFKNAHGKKFLEAELVKMLQIFFFRKLK